MTNEFIITEEQIDEITKHAFRNAGARITGILKNLKEYKEDILREELRRYLMNQGKSDITKKDIWKLLDDTKIKLQEEKMSETEKEEESSEEEGESTEESEPTDKEEEKAIDEAEKAESGEDKKEDSEEEKTEE